MVALMVWPEAMGPPSGSASVRDSPRNLQEGNVVIAGVGQRIIFDDDGVKSGVFELIIKLVTTYGINFRRAAPREGRGGFAYLTSPRWSRH